MKRLGVINCFVFLLCLKSFAQSNYAVLVEESPIGAGEIKPGIGVHTFTVNETVTLTTVAKPGWHFVYWLGDVSNPAANRTMLAVDGPKIVIAVFERDEYELPDGGTAVSSGPESLTRRTDNIPSGGLSGGSGGGDDPPTPPITPPPPPPVPEPQTMMIMVAGALFIRKKFLNGSTARNIQGPGPRNP